jgi:hypothetical protein
VAVALVESSLGPNLAGTVFGIWYCFVVVLSPAVVSLVLKSFEIDYANPDFEGVAFFIVTCSYLFTILGFCLVSKILQNNGIRSTSPTHQKISAGTPVMPVQTRQHSLQN